MTNDADDVRSWRNTKVIVGSAYLETVEIGVEVGNRNLFIKFHRRAYREHAEFYRRTIICSLLDRWRRKVSRSSTSLECQRSSYQMISDARVFANTTRQRITFTRSLLSMFRQNKLAQLPRFAWRFFPISCCVHGYRILAEFSDSFSRFFGQFVAFLFPLLRDDIYFSFC